MDNLPIRFTSFPRTAPPPEFTGELVAVFRKHQTEIDTSSLEKGLASNAVLAVLREDLVELGFEVEAGKREADKITRPVFFGEDGQTAVRYEIDAYHAKWRCGLEVEAGRGFMGNAVYRDLILASLMVDVDHFVVAVANAYRYKSGSRETVSPDYEKAVALAETIFNHRRLVLPYTLTVVGY